MTPSDEERARWADLWARYRFMYGDPQKRLAEQVVDHVKWQNIGRRK